MTLTSYFMEATYLVASILFILSLKMMSHPETARRGMFLAEGGMFAAIVGTLVGTQIVTWVWIIAGLTLGSIIGAWMAVSVPMTAMPQRTALSHAFGALAAALVGIGEFVVKASEMGTVTRGALGFEVMLVEPGLHQGRLGRAPCFDFIVVQQPPRHGRRRIGRHRITPRRRTRSQRQALHHMRFCVAICG